MRDGLNYAHFWISSPARVRPACYSPLMSVSFETVIIREGNHASIEIPESVLEELGANKRAPLAVTINSHTYRSTAVGVAGGCRVVFPQRERELAGVSEGLITVHLQLETGVRTVEVPEDLAAALETAGLRSTFEEWSYSHRREWARSVAEAKRDETKEKRIQAVIAAVASTGPAVKAP